MAHFSSAICCTLLATALFLVISFSSAAIVVPGLMGLEQNNIDTNNQSPPLGDVLAKKRDWGNGGGGYGGRGNGGYGGGGNGGYGGRGNGGGGYGGGGNGGGGNGGYGGGGNGGGGNGGYGGGGGNGGEGWCRLYHYVEMGETCQIIAGEYGIGMEELFAANNGRLDCGYLGYGQRVCVYAHERSTCQGRRHIVQPGDTCWSIAQQYGTSVALIRAANGLDRGSCRWIPVGQSLCVEW